MEAIQVAVDIAASSGYDNDIRVRTDYSGRGMYGKQCLAIITTQSVFMRFIIELAMADYDLAVKLSDRLSTDSFGRSTVYYFPGITTDSLNKVSN